MMPEMLAGACVYEVVVVGDMSARSRRAAQQHNLTVVTIFDCFIFFVLGT